MQLAWDRYKENMEQARETLLQQRTEPRVHLRPQEVNPYTQEVCARFPKSIGLGQQEKQVPLIVDQLYSCLRWTGRSAVSVYTHEANGRGDLMLGVKAAQALRLVFSTEGPSANDVALLTAAKAHAKLPELFDGCGLPYVILPGSDSNPKAEPEFAKDRAPEYVLVTPQLAATKALQTTVESVWGGRSMALTEYSKTEAAPLGGGKTFATGLGQEERGITFDADLREYKRAQEALGEDEAVRRTARLDYLATLSGHARPLLAALFPEDEAENLDENLKRYAGDTRSRLYFSYTNKSASRFALVLAEFEKAGQHDVHVVQICPEFWNPKFALNRTWLVEGLTEEPLRGYLAERGVGRVELTEFPAGSSMVRSSFETGLEGGKRLHLVVTARTGHADLLKLVRASEPVMMTTGNQSTSEALAAGKTILYESIGMEQSWAFCRSLYQGAGVDPREIARIEAVSRDYDRVRAVPHSKELPGLKEFAEAGQALAVILGNQSFPRFSDVAAAGKDLSRWISGRYLRRTLLKCPDIEQRLRKAEQRVMVGYRRAEVYEEFVQTLLTLPAG